MKTITDYKKAYAAAKKETTKNKIFTDAMIWLPNSERNEFYLWYAERMNKVNNPNN